MLTCDPRARSRIVKWYKMVEVNGAYKHCRCKKKKKKRLNRLCVMSNLKVFAKQDRQPAG